MNAAPSVVWDLQVHSWCCWCPQLEGRAQSVKAWPHEPEIPSTPPSQRTLRRMALEGLRFIRRGTAYDTFSTDIQDIQPQIGSKTVSGTGQADQTSQSPKSHVLNQGEFVNAASTAATGARGRLVTA